MPPSDPLYAAFVRMTVERGLFGAAAASLRVGRYEIERRLGAGGMSAVYLARDPELGRTVALKVLQAGASGERLANEARALAKVRHPHVVTVHDVGVHDEHPFLVIEHVEGAPLHRWARAEGRGWRDVARVGREIADGLAAVHALGLVHRDIKPDNVVIDAAGGARLLDFGLVRDVDPGADAAEPGASGTPRYLAPERRAGARASPASDQYALGVTLEELLRGLGAPAALDQVIRRARAERPEERYADVRALRDAIDAVLAPRRVWPLVAAVVAVVVIAVAVGVDRAAPGECADGASIAARRWDRGGLGERVPERALAMMDAYASRWAEAHDALCVHERDPDPLPPERRAELHACLDARLASLDDVARALPGAAPERAAELVEGLPSLIDCRVDAGGAPLEVELVQGTASEPARAALRRGLRAFRDGAVGDAVGAFAEARRLDPDYGAPLLWQAILTSHGDVNAARAPFAEAVARRSGMGAASLGLLRALTPCIQSDPVDDRACEERLAAVVRDSPRHAYAWYELARHRWNRDGSSPEVVEAFDHTLEADPTFALAHFAQGQVLAYLGRFDDALAAIDTCLREAPTAVLCLRNRIWIQAHLGACEEVAEDARRWLAIDASDPNAYAWLASASVALGEPDETVAELLRQEVLRRAPPERVFVEAKRDAWLAVLAGDLEAADRAALAMEAALEGTTDRHARLSPIRLRIALALETGDATRAAALAETTLRAMRAWTPDPRVEDFAIARDDELALLDALREAHAITDDERAARRAEWLARWSARAAPAWRPFLGLALVRWVDDVAEAEEAAAFEAELGLPPFHPYAYGASGVGRLRLLRGDVDAAIVHLTRAARGCHAAELGDRLEIPMDAIRARRDLGRAREAAGDVAGACREYTAVIARWGGARPRSLTAEDAAARRAALGCE